ncbi:hypothetical protein PR003_g150 [Phytophthora rubi]|uniref:Uncharacterized protein n=1 Tax=Phytophthora rubi TaxID=129364 RepID=A0A6A3P7F0_9STRA|nr:hypothetical protein PR001_g150 [Phytophthora rubi]KAE9360544.1 hypothetical protein PR003_g150 [Phytophthora rubi]
MIHRRRALARCSAMTRKRVVTCSSWLWSSCSWSASAARCSLHHLVCCPPPLQPCNQHSTR